MTEKKNVCIGSFAVAIPTYSAAQVYAKDFIKRHYGHKLTSRNLSILDSIFSHPSISKRHFALDDPNCLINEGIDERIDRFTYWSIDLAAKAAEKALWKAGVKPEDITRLVVNTCTGYICPGISTYLLERLNLQKRIGAYDLVGSGCGGAIPNLEVSESFLKNSDGVVLSISIEICSATFQMDNDISLILSNALFGDGASAAVLWRRPEGLQLVASARRYMPEEREAIRYVYKKGQLHNQLSLKLPYIVRKTAAEVIADLLKSQDLRKEDISHWAMHTGGEKIINAVRDEIGIQENLLWATRKVLYEYGNMSSPTVWFVMEELMKRGISSGEWCVMLAFGAGLSVHAFLLRKV
jgi:predicted naringenin-chalcone synthase